MKFTLALSLLVAAAFLAKAGGDTKAQSGQQRLGGPPPPTAEPNGFDKVRFISFVAPTGGGNTALRIKLTSLHHVDPPYTGGVTIAFTAFEGQAVWVGPPSNYVESAGSGTPFKASFTRCQPHYQDWSTVGLLHVTGSATAPSSIFHVENVDAVCQGVENSVDCQSGGINVSSQLEVRTTRWGDIESPFNAPAGSRQPDIADERAVVKKFRSWIGAPMKVRVLTAAQNAFGEINVPTITNDTNLSQMAAVIDAFRGNPYVYKMGKCAGPSTPPSSGACSMDSECTGSNGAGPCNLYCPP